MQHSGVKLANDVDLESLMALPAAEGCTGADLAFLCRRAALLAIQQDSNVSAVSHHHLQLALDALSQAKQATSN